jgi:hypothetical protein
MVGTNPLSIFGLVHNWDSTLKQNLHTSYVATEDGQTGGNPQKRLRVAEFMEDRILELGPLGIVSRPATNRGEYEMFPPNALHRRATS